MGPKAIYFGSVLEPVVVDFDVNSEKWRRRSHVADLFE